MAGTDLEIACAEGSRPVLSRLLREAQGVSRWYNLEVRYKWTDTHYYCTIDGPLPSMSSWFALLVEHLPAYARGLPASSTPARREQLARRVLAKFAVSLERVEDSLREFTGLIGGIPVSFRFDPGQLSHLKGQLNAFSEALSRFANGRAEATEFVETAHTTLEAVLRAVLPRSELSHSFSGMAESAGRQGLIGSELADCLKKLNRLRRDAKHRSQRVPQSKAVELVEPLVDACHRLLVRRS